MAGYIPPTPKMERYVLNLVRDHVYPEFGANATERVATLQAMLDTKELDKFRVSRLIDELRSAPRDESDGADSVGPGLYQRNGDIYLVKLNREKTHVYAKRLVPISGTRVTESDEDIKADWEYQPGFLQLLRPEDKMTLEQAEPFMIRYTHCIICGRFLKAATSVRQSIGPVCIKMFRDDEPEPVSTPEEIAEQEDTMADILSRLGV